MLTHRLYFTHPESNTSEMQESESGFVTHENTWVSKTSVEEGKSKQGENAKHRYL